MPPRRGIIQMPAGKIDALYQEALHHFTEVQVAEIIMTIVTINAWNRIVVSTRQEIP